MDFLKQVMFVITTNLCNDHFLYNLVLLIFSYKMFHVVKLALATELAVESNYKKIIIS